MLWFRYFLDGIGQYEVLTPELPGEPDNIRAGSNGTYWVAINLARRGKEMTFYDYLANSVSKTQNSTRVIIFMFTFESNRNLSPHEFI